MRIFQFPASNFFHFTDFIFVPFNYHFTFHTSRIFPFILQFNYPLKSFVFIFFQFILFFLYQAHPSSFWLHALSCKYFTLLILKFFFFILSVFRVKKVATLITLFLAVLLFISIIRFFIILFCIQSFHQQRSISK